MVCHFVLIQNNIGDGFLWPTLYIHTFFSLLPSFLILSGHVLLFQWKDDPDMMHDVEAASPQ